MNLKRLQAFLLVADLRSFSEAAERSDVTQSAISRQIQSLEEELGTPLMTRQAGRIELTPAGRLLYERARRWVGEWDELVGQCAAMRNQWSGVLRIGASTIPSVYMLPRSIKAFRSAYPHVELSIVTETSGDIIRRLAAGQIDVAIVGSLPASPAFEVREIADDQLVMIGASEEPPLLSLADLTKRPFILREAGSGTREALIALLGSQGLSLSNLMIAAEVNSTEAAMAMAEAGVGITVVSSYALRHGKSAGISPLLECPTDRKFYAVHARAKGNLPLIQLYIEALLRSNES